MKTRTLPILAVTIALALVRSAPAQTLTVSIQPLSTCVNIGAGATFQVEGLATNVSGNSFSEFQMGFCTVAGVSIPQAFAGSANQPSGGTTQNTTCPTFGGAGINLTATGTWANNQKNTVIASFVVSPSFSGTAIPIAVTASGGTQLTGSATFSMPVCAAAPQLQVQKSLGTSQLVNGHTRVGDVVEFDVTVSNVGSGPASSATLTDEAPAGLTPSSVMSGGPPCDVTTSYIDCRFLPPGFPAGASHTVKMFFKVTKAGDITNTAYALYGQQRATSNPVTVEAKPPRQATRVGAQPVRDLSGRPLGNP